MRIPRVAVVFLVFFTSAAQAQDGLRLNETESWVLPDSFPIAGLAVGATGDILIWSRSTSFLILLDSSFTSFQFVSLADTPVIRNAALSGTNTIQIVTANPPEIRSYGRDGHLVDQASIPLADGMLAAAAYGKQWHFLRLDQTHAASVIRIAEEPRLASASYSHVPLGSLSLQTLQMNATEEAALVQVVEAPYTTYVVPRQPSSMMLRLVPPESMLNDVEEAFANGEAPLWRTLSCLALDHGYLQTIGDLRSDLRVLVLFNDAGQFVRYAVVRASLGFAAALPARRVLIAVRRTNKSEIVKYEWRWSHYDAVGPM